MTRYSLLTIVMILSASIGQEQPKVKPDDGRWAVPDRPENCETNASSLAHVRDMMREQKDQGSVLILIARLGDGEKPHELSRRRLFNVRLKLIIEFDIPTDRIIVAEGEPVKGHGRVEFYLGGGLVRALLVDRQRDICVGCCDPDERFYPYKEKFERKRRKRAS